MAFLTSREKFHVSFRTRINYQGEEQHQQPLSTYSTCVNYQEEKQQQQPVLTCINYQEVATTTTCINSYKLVSTTERKSKNSNHRPISMLISYQEGKQQQQPVATCINLYQIPRRKAMAATSIDLCQLLSAIKKESISSNRYRLATPR